MKASALNIVNSPNPAIRFKFGTEMSINKRAIYALGSPKNIQFWWSESQRVLLIGSVSEQTNQSIKIYDSYYKSKSGMRIINKDFLKTILEITNWSCDAVYTITGEYITELNMVAFKLNEAMELRDKLSDPEKLKSNSSDPLLEV